MRRIPAQVLVTGLLFVFSVYFLLPVWWLLVASTKDSGSLYETGAFWFSGGMELGENISEVFGYGDGDFIRWLLNSLLYAGGGAAVATLLAAAAGYGMAKYDFRGKGLVFSCVLAGVLIPAPLLVLPQYLMMAELDMADTYVSVLLPSVVSPFGVFLARVYAHDAVPGELLDAGRVDGAGELRIFFTMGLRLMAPGLVTIFLFQFVAIWNNFFLPLVMLSDNDLWPVTLGLNFWNADRTHPDVMALAITGSLISVVPLIAAFLSLNRFWKSGMAAGAIKG